MATGFVGPLDTAKSYRIVSEEAMNQILADHAVWVASGFSDTVGRRANFGHVDLSGHDLSGQNLVWAVFGGANLRGTNFTGALLRAVQLWVADLTGAILNGADVRRAYCSRADLTGIHWDAQTQWERAYLEEARINPEDIPQMRLALLP